MADLEETLAWAGGVYQIEQTDPVVGGPPDLALGQGIANVQAQQLADRTGWLKAAITALQGTAVSQADIDAAIAALLDGAPGALDTLNELATALGDNDSAMAAIITQLALKLDATSYTAADVLAKMKTVDGAGSGLDADFVRGNAPVFTKEYVSSDQTIVNGGGLTLAHSMGVHPKIVVVEVICITADGSFVVGSIINISAAPAHHTGTSDTGALISPDATNIVIRIASYGLASYNPSTGAKFYLNSAKWKMRVRTYA